MTTIDTAAHDGTDTPAHREVVDPPTRVDRIFGLFTSGAGFAVFLILVLVGAFLILRSRTTFEEQGWTFFTRVEWRTDVTPAAIGVLGLLVGTVIVATIGVLIAVPVGVMSALYITDYASPRVRVLLSRFVDLLAAVPSLLYGIWGAYFLSEQVVPLESWLSRHLSWFPPFATDDRIGDTGTFFLAGIVVSLMVMPIMTSITREVFSQAPPGEKEAALALGGSRWGMVRRVVLPFGRGGIVGGAMLGLGRALGETIAVKFMLPQLPKSSLRIFENGGGTISGFIAERSGGDKVTVAGLMAAGLVLFALTLLTNLLASVVISRSRSGAGVDA